MTTKITNEMDVLEKLRITQTEVQVCASITFFHFCALRERH